MMAINHCFDNEYVCEAKSKEVFPIYKSDRNPIHPKEKTLVRLLLCKDNANECQL